MKHTRLLLAVTAAILPTINVLAAGTREQKPFGVRFWELDNEVFRWFEAEDYAWARWSIQEK